MIFFCCLPGILIRSEEVTIYRYLVRFYCACMLYMYHCWANMTLYIVLVVL